MRDQRSTWELRLESVAAITTCRCGHALDQHASGGCTCVDCSCVEARTEALEAEVEAVDEV